MEAQQAGRPGRSVWLIGAIAVAAGVVLGAVAVFVFWPDGSGSEAVSLVRAEQPGEHPFTESVQSGAVPVIEQPALEAASEARADLPRGEGTSVLVASGTEPGLYGGSGDAQACDAAKLVAYLDANPDKARAFAGVLGIEPEGIGDYVGSLTPVVLLSDTLVMNHGFRGGQATELTAVLEAGTAVMVDPQGVPRVKCNCGNPLTPPKVVPSSDWELRGEPWDGFDAASVTGVVGGDTVHELTLCDLVTGQRYTVPVGSTLTAGTPPPDIDGEWTIELRDRDDLTSPLPPGSLDPRICPTANLEGALLVIRGTQASIDGVPGLGDLVGTVEGAPPDSPAGLRDIQQAFNGAIIRLQPEGETAPEVTLTVASTPTMLAGTVSMTSAQDATVGRVPGCDAGVVASSGGAGSPATSTTSTTSTTTTSTTSTTTAPPPAGPTAGEDGPCSSDTLAAVVRALVTEPIEAMVVRGCNERWAAVEYGVGGQDDSVLLEWSGSAWQSGVCEKYRDPADWTKSPVVPAEFWIPCISD